MSLSKWTQLSIRSPNWTDKIFSTLPLGSSQATMYSLWWDGVNRLFCVQLLMVPGIILESRHYFWGTEFKTAIQVKFGSLFLFVVQKEFQFWWSSAISNCTEAGNPGEQLCLNGQGWLHGWTTSRLQLQQRSMPSREMTRMNTTFRPFITIPSHFSWTPAKNTSRTTRFLQPVSICHHWRRLIQRLSLILVIWVSSPSTLPGFRTSRVLIIMERLRSVLERPSWPLVSRRVKLIWVTALIGRNGSEIATMGWANSTVQVLTKFQIELMQLLPGHVWEGRNIIP